MMQRVNWGAGSIASLGEFIRNPERRRVFLVTGKDSYYSSGAAAAVAPYLLPGTYIQFSDFSANPSLVDLLRGISLYKAQPIDVVVAIGGGSVIDMAKLVALLALQESSPLDCLNDPVNIRIQPVPLVAVPTTAGSGSEATQFAVLYVERLKRSLDHPWLLPSLAIIDPDFSRSMSARLTAISGWDALSQAVESYWSVHSTRESRVFALAAMQLAVDSLIPSVVNGNEQCRWQMCRAAYFAGVAINITRTTAPHAVSYAMTSKFGVPHGLAVALTLPLFLQYNYEAAMYAVTDPRGEAYLRKVIEDIAEVFGGNSVADAAATMKSLLAQSGLPSSLGELQLDKENVIQEISSQVDASRLQNNPRLVTRTSLAELLHKL